MNCHTMNTRTIGVCAIILVISVSITQFTYVQGISNNALFMKSNSTAKIYANFTFPVLDNKTWNLSPKIFKNLQDSNSLDPDLNITSTPSSITSNKNSILVTYTITANGNTNGVYALFLYFCGLSPLVIDLNESEVNPVLIDKFFTTGYGCPAITSSTPGMTIAGYSNMVSKIIPTNSSDLNNKNLVNSLKIEKTPLEQFKSGIPANKIICKEGLQLVIKTEDGSPACVKPDTANILIERGWAKVSQ